MIFDVNIYRNQEIESTHKVLLTDLNSNKGFSLYLRSSFKPFQLLPFVTNKGLEKFSLDDSALALFTSSHSGEQIHTRYLQEILKDNSIDEEQLFCSPHWPLNEEYSRELASAGKKPTKIHNNCSGKHTSMLLMCKLLGFNLEDYYSRSHDLQLFLFDYLSDIFNTKIQNIAIDGCGLPIPYLNSKNMVDAAEKLKKGKGKESNAWNRIVNSMIKNPYLVAGTGRLDSVLMDKSNKKLVVKVGAEGVIFLQSELDTMVIKSIDGSRRGADLLAIHLAREQGLLRGFEFQEEKEIIYNKQGQIVGRIEISK